MHDLIVVGGGPVGSYLAGGLAGMGHDVVVVERREHAGYKACCTGIIGTECAAAFPVDGNVVLRRANSARLFSPSGKLVHAWRKEPQALIIDRRAFDRAMTERARASGARYVFDTPVTNVRREGDRVVAETGGGEEFAGRAAVIASGFGLRFSEELGLGRVGDFVAGAQADVETDLDEVEVYLGQNVAPGFFAWLVPTVPGRGRAGLLSRHSPALYLKEFLASLKAQGKIASADVKPDYGGIPLKPLAKTYGDRLLVVGDAAGQVKPTTGGGIYYGLLCADIAAETLNKALENDNLSARHLAAYQREWKRKLHHELAIGYQARRFYERLSDGQIDAIFDIIKSRGIDRALLEAHDVSFDWHGEVLLRLLGHRAISRATGVVKLPVLLKRGTFKAWRQNRDEQRPSESR